MYKIKSRKKKVKEKKKKKQPKQTCLHHLTTPQALTSYKKPCRYRYIYTRFENPDY